MEARDFKNFAYGHFTKISKALASPRRFELLDYLSQGPKTVERLASETHMSVANTSQHLQALREARLVVSSKVKNHHYYELADQEVAELLHITKRLAERRFPDVADVRVMETTDGGSVPVMSTSQAMAEVEAGRAVLIDVRAQDEYDSRHLSSALSIPLDKLEERLAELPATKKLITYCRGSYCLYASDAVRLLRSRGFDAYRLDEGPADFAISRERASDEQEDAR
ncbi:metalloregulator ArsR/SmtB family transcription factor [Planococcus sp. ISL-109]|uniref:ArsR/SmtB family transcription factor n=1 Tax=Planococcus sp. ISL-109 TaxID=2819166 RepID=UPI001BEB9BE9|nr:metalloregulator ArsR/SmtB family transcription factor [Planococcus sp. ISL-109]MBT2583240.1 ArsR family transcriptional regulator [Planococcus sp. ISL-109]